MRRKGRPKKQKSGKNTGRRPGRPRKNVGRYDDSPRPSVSKRPARDVEEATIVPKKERGVATTVLVVDDGMSEGLHVTTSQVHALGALVCCRECGENVRIGVRPTTKGMISEFTVACTVCEDTKSTNTPNLVRERKRKREKKDAVLQKTENINYAHVSAFLDNGLGYSGLRHYCKYFNARCLNEATFIVYARQVISDVVADTEESLQYSASIVREVFKSQLETDGLVDLTVAFTTTYHQWGSDFCLVAGAVIELTTGLVLDYDVANMYCHVCKINAKKIVSMSPAEMTEWFNKHQDTCEIREWCDELDHDAEEGVREIEPKYLECFIAKKIWSRSIDKFGFRYTTLIHESDEKIHEELSRADVYGDVPILIDSATSCFSRRKSEHARTSFQTKLKAKCPRERVQTKDRIMYVYSMSIPEYNKFAISSNIKLRQLVKEMEGEGMEGEPAMMEEEAEERIPTHTLQLHEVKAIKRLVANGEEEEEEEDGEREMMEEEEANQEEQEVDDPEELEEEEEEGMEQDDEEDMLEEDGVLAAHNAEEEERRKLEAEWGEEDEEDEGDEGQIKEIDEMNVSFHIKEENKSNIKEEVLGLDHQLGGEDEEVAGQHPQEEEAEQLEDDEEEEELETLRLDDDQEMEDDEEEEEEEEEIEVEDRKETVLMSEQKETQQQTTTKIIKKQQEDKPTTQDQSKVSSVNQNTKQDDLKQFRQEAIKKSQQEETNRKRKQDDEEQEAAVVKRSKLEESKQSNKEGSKQEENRQKERGQRDETEEKHQEQRDKQKVGDTQRQKEDRLKEKDDKQKTENQQGAKREEKQKVDVRQSEKRDGKQKVVDSKPSESKEIRHKPDAKPSDERNNRQKVDGKPSEKKEEKSVTEKKVTEEKPKEKEETKEKERDATKQREEESKARAEPKEKGGMSQVEKSDGGKRVREGENKATAAGEAANTRPNVTANATETDKT